MNFKVIHKLFPFIIITIVLILTSYKIFLQRQYPIPGNLLVSYNFPWSSGGWVGYNPWTTHKEQFAADAIRQVLPSLSISTELIKNLSFPLWNPYNFSGNPLIADSQAMSFGFFNLLFLVLPLFKAWTILILVQIPLAILFTYLFCRSLGLKKSPSVFAGLAYAFSTYFLYWLEIAIIGHTILWFPLTLYAIQKWHEKFKTRYLILLIVSSTACIFAGHVQTQIYIFSISAVYYFIKSTSLKSFREKRFAFLFFVIWIIFTSLITAIQTIPMLELYKNSPLTASLSKTAFQKITMPLVNLLTLFAPDLFGNPATNNFWSNQYGDGTPNIGVLPFLFAVFALTKIKKWEVKFFVIVSIIFILFTTRSPLYLLIGKLNIPFITGTTPVRSLFVLTFSLSMLAGFGLEAYLNLKKNIGKQFYLLIFTFITIFVFLLILTFIIPKIFQEKILWTARMSVARRNLLIPFAIFLCLPFAIIANNLISKIKKLPFRTDLLIILFVTIIGGVYQYNKILQFSPREDFFPDHPIIDWIQQNASINRVYGAGVSHFGSNFSTYYRIYSPEGYNVYRIRRYAELIASQVDGVVPKDYERSDATINGTFSNNEKRLLNLTGVKYLFSKDDWSRDARVNDVAKPDDDVKFVWQNGKFIIYERTKVLQRFFLSSNYLVAQSDQEILKNIYNYDFDLHIIILEKYPNLKIEKFQNADANLISYKANSIIFSVNTDKNTLLFLSDSYYPGWNAYIDNIKTTILRADYAFRAVPVPAGNHTVIFKYEPDSFKYSLILSAIGFFSLIALIVISSKKGKF